MGVWLNEELVGSRAYLAIPESGHGPGILVLHAWWGLTPDVTDVCDRLAAEGFLALAPSLFPGGATADTIPGAEALIEAHDQAPAESEKVAQAAVDHLIRHPAVNGPGIGVIGFSMGAYWAFHLSQTRPENISAVVAVYGTYDGDFSRARATYLGHYAERDGFEPPVGVRDLERRIREAGREVTFHFYPGTGHWFAEPSRPDAYDADAAAQVWNRTIAFLEKHVG